jgi:hypothetical protein
MNSLTLLKTVRWIGFFGTFLFGMVVYHLLRHMEIHNAAFWMALGNLLMFVLIWWKAGTRLK